MEEKIYRLKIAGIVVVFILVWYFSPLYYLTIYPASSSSAATPIDTDIEPLQENINIPEFSVQDRKGRTVKIIPVASYDIQARVAVSQNYPNYFNVTGLDDVLTDDMALVWGKFADKNVMKKVTFSHQWTYSTFEYNDRKLNEDIGLTYLSQHFSSNHTVAADKNIDHALRRIRKYDPVRLKGYLINMDVPGIQDEVKTSLVRTDNWIPGQGNRGGSEFIYVTELQIWDRVYK